MRQRALFLDRFVAALGPMGIAVLVGLVTFVGIIALVIFSA